MVRLKSLVLSFLSRFMTNSLKKYIRRIFQEVKKRSFSQEKSKMSMVIKDKLPERVR
jgi:hypothetical protein